MCHKLSLTDLFHSYFTVSFSKEASVNTTNVKNMHLKVNLNKQFKYEKRLKIFKITALVKLKLNV